MCARARACMRACLHACVRACMHDRVCKYIRILKHPYFNTVIIVLNIESEWAEIMGRHQDGRHEDGRHEDGGHEEGGDWGASAMEGGEQEGEDTKDGNRKGDYIGEY